MATYSTRPRPGQWYELGATWIESEELAYNTHSGVASNSGRRGLVRFADGKLRIVRLGVADTYFSMPAKPAHGRIGTVMVEDGEYRFHAYPAEGN